MSVRFPWAVLAVWIVIVAPSPASGQGNDDLAAAAMQIGEGIGAQVGAATAAAQQMRASAGQASAEIEAARRRYWRAYQSGRDVKAAKAEYAHQLAGKDLYYLLMAIPEGTEGPRNRLAEIVSGGIDGGIRPAAMDEFVAWVNAIRRQLGVGTTPETMDRMVLPGPARLAEAVAAAREQEAAYRRARDWAELDASGVTFPWDTDARLYVLMLLQRYGPVRPAEEVVENYRELLNLFGTAEVVAAAERVRAARRDETGHLVNPSSIGVGSTQPDLAFTEILATRSGRDYFKYLIWRGALNLPGHTPAEAGRQYDRFAWAYGETAIETAADSVLNLPKNQFGRIDVRGPANPRLPGEPVVAVWTLLRQGDPDGRIRAIFAFHPEAMSRADVDRLRGDLERRYGAEAVAQAARALYAFRYLEDLDGPNHERRTEFRREALEAAGLSRNSGAHLYQSDHRLLAQVLERGAVAVLGEHVPARTAEQRVADRLAEDLERIPDWQRRTFLIERELFEGRAADAGDRHSDWRGFVATRFTHAARILLDPANERSRGIAGIVRANMVSIWQVVGTVQIHCDLSLDARSDACELARKVEASADEMWAAIAARWPDDDVERPTNRAGVPDSERALGDVTGAWSGTFRDDAGNVSPVTVRIAVPASAGEPVGTVEYTRRVGRMGIEQRLHRSDLYFLGSGFIGLGFSGGVGSYSLHSRPTEGGGETMLVTVQRTDAGQLEVIWYQRPPPRRGGDDRHRRIGSGRLDPRPATADRPPQPMPGCPGGVAYEWIDRMPVRSHLTGGTLRNDTLVVVNRRARPGTATVRLLLAPPNEARNVTATGRDRRVNEAAVALMEASRFSPGSHRGQPACVWLEYTVRFQQRR